MCSSFIAVRRPDAHDHEIIMLTDSTQDDYTYNLIEFIVTKLKIIIIIMIVV